MTKQQRSTITLSTGQVSIPILATLRKYQHKSLAENILPCFFSSRSGKNSGSEEKTLAGIDSSVAEAMMSSTKKDHPTLRHAEANHGKTPPIIVPLEPQWTPKEIDKTLRLPVWYVNRPFLTL